MIRVVVFDFDGTLVESNRVKEVCLHRTAAALRGGEAALAAACKTGGDRYQIFEDVARKLSTTSVRGDRIAVTRVLVNTYCHCCAMGIIAAAERRGARRALAGLSQRGLRIWVLSAPPDGHLTNLLRRRGLLRSLRGSYGSFVSKEQGLRQIMSTETPIEIMCCSSVMVRTINARHGLSGLSSPRLWPRLGSRQGGRFAIRDLRPLVPLIAYLNGERRVGT
jgi:phosphoglycolate phosphatase